MIVGGNNLIAKIEEAAKAASSAIQAVDMVVTPLPAIELSDRLIDAQTSFARSIVANLTNMGKLDPIEGLGMCLDLTPHGIRTVCHQNNK